MTRELDFISLFAGFGGMDLGLERAGMRCVVQVEINDYANKVLAKHWPTVPRFGDVRDVGAHNLPRADLICGGFPCQDISYAGKGAGLAGARSGLWYEFARIVGELRPRYVLVENVAALLTRGIGDVLGSLASFGYDAEWHVIPALAVGAPHIRERVFMVAYTECKRSIEQYEPTQIGRRSNETEQTRMGGSRVFTRRPNGEWPAEPAICRVVDGVSRGLERDRRERLRGLGNAVVPQVAEYIGRMIIQYHEATS